MKLDSTNNQMYKYHIVFPKNFRFIYYSLIFSIISNFIIFKVQAQNNIRPYLTLGIGTYIQHSKFTNTDAYQLDQGVKRVKRRLMYSIGIGTVLNDRFRMNLNFSYRDLIYKGSDIDTDPNDPQPPLVAHVRQKILTRSMFLNGEYDLLKIKKVIIPYLTLGIGYSRNKAKDLTLHLSGARVTSGNIPPEVIYPGTTKNNVAWNIGTGIRLVASDKFNLNFYYKFVDLGKIAVKHVQRYPELIGQTQKLRLHEIMAGIVYHI